MGRHEIIGADGRVMVVDDNGYVLRDGEKLRVPMQFRDSMSPMQKAVADAAVRFDDGGGGRPGTQFDFDAAHAVKETARNEMIADMVDAWKTPTADGRRWRRVIERDPEGRERGSQEWEEEDSASQKAGDACTINGAPGHLNAKLQCVPDRHDAAAGLKLKQDAYDAMCADMREAWRGNRT